MDASQVEILLVEDNPADAELTLDTLKSNKISNNVHLVKDGEEALQFVFRQGRYKNVDHSLKVILLDLKLPKIDGLEVLKILKGDAQAKLLPIVVLTSSKEERDIVESYQLGVNSYIIKPVDFNQFAEAVKNLGVYWMLINETPAEKPQQL